MVQKCPKMEQKCSKWGKNARKWAKNAPKLPIFAPKMAKTLYVYITPGSSIEIQLKALGIRSLSLSVHFLRPM